MSLYASTSDGIAIDELLTGMETEEVTIVAGERVSCGGMVTGIRSVRLPGRENLQRCGHQEVRTSSTATDTYLFPTIVVTKAIP